MEKGVFVGGPQKQTYCPDCKGQTHKLTFSNRRLYTIFFVLMQSFIVKTLLTEVLFNSKLCTCAYCKYLLHKLCNKKVKTKKKNWKIIFLEFGRVTRSL